MDKFMNNHWVMKAIALLIALMLFTSVSFETKDDEKDSTGFPAFNSNHKETLNDIPVSVYYDEENLVVSGVPQTVEVKIEGPASVTKTAGLQKEIEVFADLTNLTIGTHKVKLKHKNISEKIKVEILPLEITVVIQEKVTKEFSVDVDFVNESQLEEGYVIETPTVKPRVVKITGAKEEVERIALVKALVDLKGVDGTVTQESRVAVYDKNQNVLSVNVEPQNVEITVPITSPSKTVSFSIKQKGELPEGLSLVEIKPVPSEVTIYGPKDVIDSINSIDDITVELDKIEEDTTLDVKIPLPKGIEKISPETIQVQVDVEEEKSTTLSNLPIKASGLGSGFSLNFLNPASGTLNLEVFGAPSVVSQITPSSIELFINIANLGKGEHDVKLEVNGPQNISWVLPQNNVRVSIIER